MGWYKCIVTNHYTGKGLYHAGAFYDISSTPPAAFFTADTSESDRRTDVDCLDVELDGEGSSHIHSDVIFSESVGVKIKPTFFGEGYTVVQLEGDTGGGYYLASYNEGAVVAQLAANATGAELGTRTSSIIIFTTNNTEFMRALTNQAVVIGSNMQAGAEKLRVNGLIHSDSDSIIVDTAKTPSSASDTGTQGQIAWDASYIYVCTATDTWKRSAIATW